jgi:hypothetical protein
MQGFGKRLQHISLLSHHGIEELRAVTICVLAHVGFVAFLNGGLKQKSGLNGKNLVNFAVTIIESVEEDGFEQTPIFGLGRGDLMLQPVAHRH